MKKAFTLTELLIALAVLGLLIAVLTPVISNLIPDQNALMAKRSYYAAQTIVSELINDEACYPDMTQASYYNAESGGYDNSNKRIGFDDGFGYQDCYLWGGSGSPAVAEGQPAVDYINSENALNKFTTLFKSKLDVRETKEDGSFVTRDGTHWVIVSSLTANNKNSYLTISVDVNGDENPNCAQTTDASAILSKGTTCTGRQDGFDVYSIKVYADGGMEINDDWAKKAVDVNKDITNIEDEPAATEQNTETCECTGQPNCDCDN